MAALQGLSTGLELLTVFRMMQVLVAGSINASNVGMPAIFLVAGTFHALGFTWALHGIRARPASVLTVAATITPARERVDGRAGANATPQIRDSDTASNRSSEPAVDS